MKIEIVTSVPSDAHILTEIAVKAKKHWGYSDEQIETWRSELTITEGTIQKESVFQLNIDSKPIGVYSLRTLDDDTCEIEHFWLLPEYIGKGFGRRMFDHLLEIASQSGAKNIRIVSDPNAEGFYLKMGARKVGEEESSIKGRALPILKIEL